MKGYKKAQTRISGYQDSGINVEILDQIDDEPFIKVQQNENNNSFTVSTRSLQPSMNSA